MELDLERSLSTDLRRGQLVTIRRGNDTGRCSVYRLESIPDARRRVVPGSAADECFNVGIREWPLAHVAWLRLIQPPGQTPSLHSLVLDLSGLPVFVLGRGRYKDLLGRELAVEVLQSSPRDN